MPRPEARHVPVLAEAALEWLAVRPGGVYVDATAGAGGHASRIAAALRGGRLIALDRDRSALELARTRLAGFSGVEFRRANYAELEAVLAEAGVVGVDGVLIDAGCSSMQLDDPARGFSFQEEGPLDMRMDAESGEPAGAFLARTTERELAAMLRRYGDIGPARRIARAILARRDAGRLATTTDLAAAVSEGLPFVRGVPDEVRTCFQAIRMAVNRELEWLEQGLAAAAHVLNPGGRLVVIAFHSGEDRVVKQFFQGQARKRRELHPDGRVKQVIPPRLRILTPRPVLPSPEEVESNPRSASAKLRAAARLETAEARMD